MVISAYLQSVEDLSIEQLVSNLPDDLLNSAWLAFQTLPGTPCGMVYPFGT